MSRRFEVGEALSLRRLSPRDRRAIRLGLAILIPALLWVVVVRPYRNALTELRDRTAAERALLGREEALLARAPTLPAAIQTARDNATRAELRLVRAPNAPLAEAEVTRFLQDVAGLSRVLLHELRGLEVEPDFHDPAGLLPIRLAVRAESDLEGMLTFLHRIETSPLLLRVVELSAEPVVERRRPSRRRSDDDGDEVDEPRQTSAVAFALVVQAYAPGDAAEPPPPSAESTP